MNWKPTAVLFAVAVALLVFFRIFETNHPGTKDANEGRLVIMDRDQMESLTITNHDVKVELHHTGLNEWTMKSPIADRADLSLISEVMSDLETAKYDDIIPAADFAAKRSNLQDFGLQSPRLRLQITPKDGQPGSEFLFGNDTPVQGKSYVQIAGRGDVYIIGSELKKVIDKDVNSWRDHRLMEVAATEISKMTVKNSAGELELQRNGDHWQITKPLNARGNDQKINDLVSQVTNMTVGSFVADDKADAATYGLADPRGVVTVYTGKDAKGTELIIGSARTAADKNNPAAYSLPGSTPAPDAGDGSIYLRMPSRQSIYTVAKGAEDFLNLKPGDVRDRSLARINADTVDRIHITPAAGTPLTPLTLARKDKEWTILAPGSDKPGNAGDQAANAAEVNKLIQGLNQATVSAFVADTASDLAKYGLDKPQLKIAFDAFASENTAESAAGEKPVATVSFGKVDEPSVYVRVEEEPFVVSVPRAVMDAIPVERTQFQPLNIFEADPEKFSSLAIKGEGRPELALTRADKGPWTLVKGTGPLEEAKVQSVANTLAKLHAVRWVASNLPPDSGLEPAAFATLRFETPNDAKNSGTLLLGHTGPENMGYGRVEGKPGTFLISRPDYDTLLQSVVPAPAPTPTPTPAASAAPASAAVPATNTPAPADAAPPAATAVPAAATPQPATPTPAPTASATPVATAAPAPATPAPATPVPNASATPVAVATPSPTATPAPAPVVLPSPVAVLAVPTPGPVTTPAAESTSPPPAAAPASETPAASPNLPPP